MSTPHLTIRPAVIEDLDAICGVHARARATYYAGFLPSAAYNGPAELERQREGTAQAIASREYTVLCATRQDHIVGFAVVGARFEGDKLFHFHIDPEVWRTGTGTALHRACVEVWRSAKLTTARLEVFASNARARAFYARQGWEEDGRDDDHVTMRLLIPSLAPPQVSVSPHAVSVTPDRAPTPAS